MQITRLRLAARLATIRLYGIVALGTCAGLSAPLACAATGDLDPSFADYGRLAPIGNAGGTALFVESLGPDSILVGGGDIDITRGPYEGPGRPCKLEASSASFASQLSEDGSVHRLLDPLTLNDVEASAFARQTDGKIVVVGRIVHASEFRCLLHSTPTIFRLNSDGSLDASFGVRELPVVTEANSLVLDHKARPIIAGVRPRRHDPEGNSELIVLRLRTDGKRDRSFGTDGFFIGPMVDSPGFTQDSDPVRLLRVSSGSYRVALTSHGDCRIVGITMSGGLDTVFGSAGDVTVRGAGGAQVTCDSVESDADGRLLVAGSSRNHGFVARLLPRGGVDSAFGADAAIARFMTAVTSVAIAGDAKLLVAGSGLQGTSIMRLLDTGGLDASYGDAGQSWIDLKSKVVSNPIVRDMLVRADGSVIAVGGAMNYDRPFVVRLLGDGGGTSHGVIGFSRGYAAALEADGKAMLRVRRSGGRDGAVSATYRTVPLDATEPGDFVAKSGTLQWAAGDTSYKTVALGIVEGGETGEALEAFRVVLGDIEGGAGAGTRTATVDIQPDGSPGGQLGIDTLNIETNEGNDTFQVQLNRTFYFGGPVCVTLTAKSASATAGKDFSGKPGTVCWNDQEEDTKLLDIQIFEDFKKEGLETFTLELSNPTGGAVIGPAGSVTIRLRDNE